ncbi:MAG: hypothetical protein ACI8PB_004787 [Desulforhopalus sp.]|jgi:hypothetical protein
MFFIDSTIIIITIYVTKKQDNYFVVSNTKTNKETYHEPRTL